jgi:hypothetical protein
MTPQRYMGIKTDGTKRGEPKNIEVIFNRNVMTDYGYTYADIFDISMNFKKDIENDLDDSYLQKKKSQIVNGNPQVLLDESTNTFTMVINQDDYDNLNYETYFICVNVKINGVTDFIEIDKIGIVNRPVEIIKDSNRE